MTAVLDHSSPAAPARNRATVGPQRGVPEQVSRARTGAPVGATVDRGTALVALADSSLRRAAVRVLRGLGTREVLAAPDATVARAIATRRPGSACVVQPAFGAGTGLSLVREAAAGGWTTTVVVDHRAEGPDAGRGARAALAAGSRCYLLVDPADENGDAPAQRRPQGRTAEPIPPTAGWDELSEREVQVLALVADGCSNREVGEALGLSALTVKSHLARIARKLGTGDRAEMVVIALRAGLVH